MCIKTLHNSNSLAQANDQKACLGHKPVIREHLHRSHAHHQGTMQIPSFPHLRTDSPQLPGCTSALPVERIGMPVAAMHLRPDVLIIACVKSGKLTAYQAAPLLPSCWQGLQAHSSWLGKPQNQPGGLPLSCLLVLSGNTIARVIRRQP